VIGSHGINTVHTDLDNTLVDFAARLPGIDPAILELYLVAYDEIPGMFALMPPVANAIDAYRELVTLFDTYILSTAPWRNPSAWQHRVEWVQLHLGADPGTPAYKRLILSHHKQLNRGDFLVDDRSNNGAGEFEGEWLRFGSERFPGWDAMLEYLRERA